MCKLPTLLYNIYLPIYRIIHIYKYVMQPSNIKALQNQLVLNNNYNFRQKFSTQKLRYLFVPMNLYASKVVAQH